MRICKVDTRGRVQLKKLIMDLPGYYKFDEDIQGRVILTPMHDLEELTRAMEYLESRYNK
jgi:hypothetical protein